MATVSLTDDDVDTSDTSSYSFTSTIGTNGGSDSIYIFVAGRTTSGASSVTVTVDGVSATSIVSKAQNNGGAVACLGAIFAISRNSLPSPNNTTVTVAATFSAGCIRAVCDVWVSANAGTTAFATSSASTTDDDTGPATLTLDLNAPASGIVIGGVYSGNGTNAISWTGLTADHEGQVGAEGNRYSSASASNVSSATPRTVSATHNPAAQPIGVAASFSASSTTTDGVVSAAGVGAVTATGDSIVACPVTANGVAASALVADSIVDGVVNAPGTGAVAATGTSIVDATYQAAGAATVTLVSDVVSITVLPTTPPGPAENWGGSSQRSNFRKSKKPDRQPRTHTIKIGHWPEEEPPKAEPEENLFTEINELLKDTPEYIADADEESLREILSQLQ